MAPLECIEGPEDCVGDVAMRWPGYGERTWPRCVGHGDARIAREEEATRRSGTPDSPCAPLGFDPLDAGERREDD